MKYTILLLLLVAVASAEWQQKGCHQTKSCQQERQHHQHPHPPTPGVPFCTPNTLASGVGCVCPSWTTKLLSANGQFICETSNFNFNCTGTPPYCCDAGYVMNVNTRTCQLVVF